MDKSLKEKVDKAHKVLLETVAVIEMNDLHPHPATAAAWAGRCVSYLKDLMEEVDRYIDENGWDYLQD